MTEKQRSDYIASLKKQYGKGIMFKGDDKSLSAVETVSSGSIKLDDILGGGYAKGRMIEIYGKESCGKTSFAYMTIAEHQKLGEVLYVDTEQTVNLEYAAQLGVDVSKMWLSQPASASEALNLIYDSLEGGLFSLIVLDSVAALVAETELSSGVEDKKMAVIARMMSEHTKKVNSKKTNTTVLYINQTRTNIGFRTSDKPTGGNSLGYYASQRLLITRTSYIKKGEEVIGNQLKVKVVKNKVAFPQKVANISFYYGEGVIKEMEVIELGVLKKLIQKKGAWYYDIREEEPVTLGQGIMKAVDFLRDNSEYFECLLNEVLKK